MSWVLYVFIFLGVVALFIIAFFLFAIWRAIIGKSGVELKLANSINLHTKKIDTLDKSFDKYASVQSSLKDETREAKRYLKDIITNRGDEKKS